jgi:hypothetical protein
MRTELTTNNRPGFIMQQVMNLDTSGTQNSTTSQINRGTPLVLNLSSTPQPTTAQDGFAAGFQDGLQVVLPSTAGAIASLFFAYGVAMNTILPDVIGEAMVSGVCEAVFEIILTRTSTTSVWASYAALTIPYVLSIDTANNAFATYSSAPTAGSFNAQVALVDSIASFTTNASTIGIASLTSYCSTLLARVFVRQM